MATEEKTTLYSFFNGDRSNRVRWCLEELGLNYEEYRVDWKNGETKSDEFLKMSPFGKVPVLKIGEEVYFDSGATCVNLADKYSGKKLSPKFGTPIRARFNEWCFSATTTIEPILSPLNSGHKFHHEIEEAAAVFAKAQFETFGANLNKILGNQKFILGEDFSVADILMATTLRYGLKHKIFDQFDEIKGYINRSVDRPAAAKALA